MQDIRLAILLYIVIIAGMYMAFVHSVFVTCELQIDLKHVH